MTSPLLSLTTEDICAVHDASIERFGGAPGIRDEGLLVSAVAQPFQSFGGEDLYPSPAEKAARYAYGIIANHPFVDGNKRTGTAALGAFLRLNGYCFKPNSKELLIVMLSVAAGESSYEQLAAWVGHMIKPPL